MEQTVTHIVLKRDSRHTRPDTARSPERQRFTALYTPATNCLAIIRAVSNEDLDEGNHTYTAEYVRNFEEAMRATLAAYDAFLANDARELLDALLAFHAAR